MRPDDPPSYVDRKRPTVARGAVVRRISLPIMVSKT